MIKVNGFALKNFTTCMTDDGFFMDGILTYNGKNVVNFHDDGRGGGMYFRNGSKDIEKLQESILATYEKHGLSDGLDWFGKEFAMECFINDVANLYDLIKKIKKVKKRKCVDERPVVYSILRERKGTNCKNLSFIGVYLNDKYPANYPKVVSQIEEDEHCKIVGYVDDIKNRTINAEIFNMI